LSVFAEIKASSLPRPCPGGVETSTSGKEAASFDTGVGAGGLFGITLTPDRHGVLFVNGNENSLELLH
jgi:hypothetical protein